MPDDGPQANGASGTQHVVHILDRDPVVGKRQQLFQQRLAISQRTGGAAGQQFQRVPVGVGPLGLDDLRQPLDDGRRFHRCKVVSLTPRQHRDGNLVRVGRAEDELHMLRWLLQRLEQGIEGLARQHVDFVDDVDLEPCPAGPHVHVGSQLADLVNAAIAGPVDLQHVHVLAARDADTHVAAIRRGGPWGPRCN